MESGTRETPVAAGWNLAALAAAALGAAVRCVPWPHVFSADRVVPLGVDPYYHLRRAALLADGFPASPHFDAYLSFPSGAPIPWPPGFDLLIAVPALLGADTSSLPLWGSLLMPALGALAVYGTYRFGLRVAGPGVALLGAALLAILPGAAQFSLLGRIDHHALVAPLILGMYLTFLASVRGTTPRRVVGWGATCGALAAAATGSWIVTPSVYFLPIPVTLIGLSLAGAGERLRLTTHACLGAACVGVLLVVLATGDLAARPFSLYQPSFFVVSLFALAWAAGATATARPRWLLPLGGGGAVLAAGLAVAVPALRAPLVDALGVVSGGDTSYLTAWESHPLLYHGEVFAPGRAVVQYGALVLLLPVLAGAFGWSVHRTGSRDPAAWLFAAVAGWSTALLFLQQRFGEFAAPFAALTMAWALVEGARALRRHLATADRDTRPLALAWVAAAIVALISVALPATRGLRALMADDPVAHQRGLLAFAELLADHSPDPGPADAPDYGVLTSWMDAHPLLYASGRPVAASSFATEEAHAGNRRAFSLLLGSDEAATFEAMKDEKLRYLVVSPILESVEAMASIAGFEERFVEPEVGVDAEGQRFERYRPLLPFAESLHTRLLLADGSEIPIHGFVSPPSEHFRLHVESDVPVELFGGRVPRFKAFEAVRGVHIAGAAAPGTEVHLELIVQSNIGRRFAYVRAGRADESGRFEFVAPYATHGSPKPTRAVGPYRLRIGDRVYEIAVPEGAVRNGETIAVAGLESPPSSALRLGLAD